MKNFAEKVGDHYDAFEAAMMRLSDVIDEQMAQDEWLLRRIDNAADVKESTERWLETADALDKQLEQLDKVAGWIDNHNEKLMGDYLDR